MARLIITARRWWQQRGLSLNFCNDGLRCGAQSAEVRSCVKAGIQITWREDAHRLNIQ